MAMNAQFLGKTRPKLADGDVFRLVMPGNVEIFGLIAVAAIDDRRGSKAPLVQGTLVYIYRPGVHPSAVAPASTTDLLVPPIITNRLGFTRFGVWQKCGSLGEGYVYGGWDRFVFWATGEIVDVWCRLASEASSVARLEAVEQLVGPYWVKTANRHLLRSPAAIDDMISDALGIPRAAVTPEDFK